MTVWKFELRITDVQEVRMPRGAELLCVGTQAGTDGVVMLWARVGIDAARSQPLAVRRIRIAGTGHPDATGDYVGTVQLHGGALVFHVFDLGEVLPWGAE
jgi:hypothetical protein